MYNTIVVLGIGVIIGACAGNGSSHADGAPDGAALYKKYCVLCHGTDGTLGLNGSKDITLSVLTLEERVIQITNGKNTMTPFAGIMSPEEIKAVAEYSMTLKK